MDAQVQAIVNSLTSSITIPVTQSEIPSIVVAALAATASMPTLSSSDREQVVLAVVQYYISKSNIPISEQTVIMNLIPAMIVMLTSQQTQASYSMFCSSITNWFKNNCGCCCSSSSCCQVSKPSGN